MANLLDTSVVVHLRERNAAILASFDGLNERPFISVVTRVELEGGVYAHPEWRDMRREAVDALLRILPQSEFNDAMAAIYGQIVARAGFSRRKIIDRMIAATALALDLTLITTNPDDFCDIDGLKLLSWQA